MKETKIIKINPLFPEKNLIREAAKILSAGGLVAFPTETVYGLAVVMTNDSAIEKLKDLKKRNQDKKFSIGINEIRQAEELAEEISPFAYRLMRRFWPGPLTLILPAKGGTTVGLRMPDHPAARMLLRETGVPVFLPSANFSGEEPALCAEDVLKRLGGYIDAVIDSGRVKWGTASTVCEINGSSYKILRAGVIREEMIKAQARNKSILFVCTGNSCRSAMAEGFMKNRLAGYSHINVRSAGVAAYEGMAASEEAVRVMMTQGIDISNHEARRLTDEMIKESDMILVMEPGHKQHILMRVPGAQKRVFLLKEFAPENEEENPVIPDPIGMDERFYEQVALMLKKSIEGVVAKLHENSDWQ